MIKPRPIDNDILLGEICIHLSQGKRVKLRAKGNSMRPFIHGNEDILLLSQSDTLCKGDVVLARIEGKRYVIHRIVGIRGDRITLMGDANLYQTEECFRSDVYGAVECIIRNGEELNIGSICSRFTALAWRTLLPIRRVKAKISNLIEKQ